MTRLTPAQAWRQLRDGNDRFYAGQSIHPSQGIEDRSRLADGQSPGVVMFGCSDSRVAAEIIFDQGLGDMFVVRTAGHVVDSSVIGSIEYATEVLEVPLIAVMGHDSCGAVTATVNAIDDLEIPGGHIRTVVEKIAPSVLAGKSEGLRSVDQFVARHVKETGTLITQRSNLIRDRIDKGEVAIVGLTYRLSDGHVSLGGVVGDVGES